jgi:hypothetical protein
VAAGPDGVVFVNLGNSDAVIELRLEVRYRMARQSIGSLIPSRPLVTVKEMSFSGNWYAFRFHQ